jgi:hypothetical protein
MFSILKERIKKVNKLYLGDVSFVRIVFDAIAVEFQEVKLMRN